MNEIGISEYALRPVVKPEKPIGFGGKEPGRGINPDQAVAVYPYLNQVCW